MMEEMQFPDEDKSVEPLSEPIEPDDLTIHKLDTVTIDEMVEEIRRRTSYGVLVYGKDDVSKDEGVRIHHFWGTLSTCYGAVGLTMRQFERMDADDDYTEPSGET